MTESDSASRQLHVIRALMERATIYRSLSAPTAFVGGLLSLGGFGLAYYAKHHRHQALSPAEFLVVWLVILALTSLTNAFFLWREARRRDTPFLSAGMKCALGSVLPPFLSAGFVTLIAPSPLGDAFVWILFYGLGLLSMQHFAPRSIVVLGWCFLIAACLGLLLPGLLPEAADNNHSLAASWLMAATFGGFHLAYAAAVWALGGERDGAPEITSTESGNV